MVLCLTPDARGVKACTTLMEPWIIIAPAGRVHNLLLAGCCPPQDPCESAWRMEWTSCATQAFGADKGSGGPKDIAAMNSLHLTGVLAGALFVIYPSCH